METKLWEVHWALTGRMEVAAKTSDEAGEIIYDANLSRLVSDSTKMEVEVREVALLPRS